MLVSAAPASTVGDTTNTYAFNQGVSYDYVNQDTTPSKNVYACVVTTATDTADESHAVYLQLSGPQN